MNYAETDLSLVAAVNHATDSLGLYRAELARILCLLCRDVSESANLDLLLDDNKRVQKKAERFVYFYELLEERFRNDSAGMVHWFRKYNATLGTTPFHAMVDDDRLEDVIAELAQSAR
ncbi:hypothetical protein [Kaarinaea lacus]